MTTALGKRARGSARLPSIEPESDLVFEEVPASKKQRTTTTTTTTTVSSATTTITSKKIAVVLDYRENTENIPPSDYVSFVPAAEPPAKRIVAPPGRKIAALPAKRATAASPPKRSAPASPLKNVSVASPPQKTTATVSSPKKAVAAAVAAPVAVSPVKRATATAAVSPVKRAAASPTKLSTSESPVKPRFNPVTPTTKRYRNVSASPSTPRTVVMSAGRLFKRVTPSTPRFVHLTDDTTPTTTRHSRPGTPSTPSTPSGPSSSLASFKTVYHDVRQLFSRGADPGQLIGRDEEKVQIDAFLARCAAPQKADAAHGCLYVSGPPGTGKSAMCTDLAAQMARKTPGVQHAFINCMSIKNSKDLFVQLLVKLGVDETAMLAGDPATVLAERFLAPEGPTYLVVLDEIDHILTMGMESLPRLFEWSLQRPSRLVLIGIANALDLTDRFLPRLKAKGLKPQLLPFLPYTAPQIKNIILTRLKSLVPPDATNQSWLPFLHPAAVELCSRKIAAQTGDLRKAFEVVRRSLDLIEMDTLRKFEDDAKDALAGLAAGRQPLAETANNSAVLRAAASGIFPAAKTTAMYVRERMDALTPETAPRVSISHLNKVTSAAFSHGTSQRIRTLNLQQRAAVCALVALERRNRQRLRKDGSATGTPSKSGTSAPTVKMLYDAYAKLCTCESVLHPLSSSEFREVVDSLETLGLVNAVDGRTGGLVAPAVGAGTPSKRGRRTGFMASGEEKRVASCVAEEEAEQAAQGVGAGILQSILSGEGLEYY
ncbi:hypothetical protein TD95_004536 [Thielaviopsis punctulata]|uniref:AAA+ ATPase domain-containing protein n=1 Tax=Thielaviopsis punctulata TaxID=72032 RepID=A0A0F4ZFX8_9PEZI|nr:hypothetical protein TD95_004536 [Thielaviopsis punctulata]